MIFVYAFIKTREFVDYIKKNIEKRKKKNDDLKKDNHSKKELDTTNNQKLIESGEKSWFDQIEIDLPDKKDLRAMDDAFRKEISWYSGKSNNYPRLKECTDMAHLTGKDKYNNYFYLRDPDETDDTNTNLLYYCYGDICNVDIHDKDTEINWNRYYRQFLAAPVLSFDKCPEIFDQILALADKETILYDANEKPKYATVELGWMPMVATKSQDILNSAYKEKRIIKTNHSYTFDSVYTSWISEKIFKSVKPSFSPVKYYVYEFANKMFIRFKVSQCLDDCDLIDKLCFQKSRTETLPNSGESVRNGDYIWVEVSRIPWVIDIERKRLISKKGLLSGIQFQNYSKHNEQIDYPSSNIKNYFNTYMKHEIFAFESLLCLDKKQEENSNDSTKEEPTNAKKDEIISLMKQIHENEKYYLGKENIKEKAQKYYNEYKNAINNLDNNDNVLYLETRIPNSAYNNFVSKLNDILDELLNHSKRIKDCQDMLEILNECSKDEIDSNKGELCSTMKYIKEKALPFITNMKRRNELNRELTEIINNSIKRIKSYIVEIKNDSTNTKVKTMEELRREIAVDLDPFLNKLHDVVSKQNVVNEILKSTKAMIKNQFYESKNSIAISYLNELNNIISEIKQKGNDNEIKKLNTLKLNYDVGTSMEDIITILTNNIVIANTIKLEIEQRLNEEKVKEEYNLDLDINSIFKK